VSNLRIEIAPKTIALVFGVLGVLWVLAQLTAVVLVITVALIIAGTVDPAVAWFEKNGIRRGRALVLVFFVLVLALVAILVATIPPLVAQVSHLIEEAPTTRQEIIEWVDVHVSTRLAQSMKEIPVDNLIAQGGREVVAYSSDVLAFIGYAITTLVLAIYLLADPRRSQGVVYAVVPRHYHLKLAKILIELKRIVGGYMRGQLITSLAIGVFMYLVLTILGVDNAFAIAVFAALTDVIPFVGGYIASAPAILAVSSRGWVVVTAVLVLMAAYQEFESRILVPRVYGRTLRLTPSAVIVALLVGGSLMGITGALLALPIAAGLRMVLRELRVELPGEAPPSATARARDEQAEEAYEHLTEGVPATDAAQIANEIVKRLGTTGEHTATGTPSTSEDVDDQHPDPARR
jgi:predicted PurR-regulated permease PerM